MKLTIKERLEEREHAVLSPYACFSSHSRGRERPIKPCTLRTEFQRDRDRIIHSKAFRRLKHKTQMFLSPEGDHYRTRLTHTLEVSQIARAITRALFLNEDLTEAIALGHDLGHTPFGHMGERTLDRLMKAELYKAGMKEGGDIWGFSHNDQSLRVVEKLENGTGLNLTFEVRNGILCHSGEKNPITLEGIAVHLSDRIAYINHDIDDAIRAGILKIEELPSESVAFLGHTHGERIDTLISDIVRTSGGQNYIKMSDKCYEAMDSLRSFLFKFVYKGEWARLQEVRADRLLSLLFSHYIANPGELPGEYGAIVSNEGVARAVCDYIATMTDRYALKTFMNLFTPSIGF